MGKRVLEDIKSNGAKARRKYGDLKQFYIGSFDVRVNGNDEKFMRGVENKIARRGETEEGKDFAHLRNLLKSKNVVFAHLMTSAGDSYLEAIYVMNLSQSDFKESDRPKRNKEQERGQGLSLLPLHHHGAGFGSGYFQGSHR